ncbi:putative transcription factor homeobox-WOX family [Helianthus annuus]|nr:putative transcription factor homeobox-WOX family [Helianthus annuus]
MIVLVLIYKPYFHLLLVPPKGSIFPDHIHRIYFSTFKIMNHEEETCNTTLGLGIGVVIKREKPSKNKKRGFWLDLSLPLHPKIEASDDYDYKNDDQKDDQDSFSSKTIDDQEERKGASNVNISNNNDDGSRKKLKLTTEQTTMLEDSFNIHSTLNTGQKQELAKKLNLLPRQIEVWFQNRRARTKLKQIEKEYELLKKSYETLNDENRRLKKELQEVRCSLKSDHHHHHHQMPLPFFVQYTTTTTMHHRPCDKIGNSGEEKKAFAVMNGGNMDHVRDNSNNKNATAAKLL